MARGDEDPPRLPPCVFLAGATATGKTALAVELALRLGAEVVSADSMLVYRHMDIGTAKPTVEERRGVAHHLVDVVDPDEHFDAARYRRRALSVLAGLADRGVPAVVAGGTGLYLRALRWGLAEAPGADPAFRDRLGRWADREGTAALHARLSRVDPETARSVHPHDLVRIERALEIHHVTGRPASALRAEHGFRDQELDALVLVLDVPGPELRRRIRLRAERMVERGLVDEVKRLEAMGYGPELRPLRALNYRHAREHLEGRVGAAGMVERMATDTWRFSRRQRRWFRAEPGARTVEPRVGVVEALARSHLERA
jgi:tRNA dimethylallyltransferase